METQIDSLECLEPDMALKILTCLDDSADLVRASAVSRYWQNIVVSNGLSKQLCMRTFPGLASIACVIEPSCHDSSGETQRDHRAYASLFRAITAFPLTYCIANPVSASSTDRYPDESIINTMVPMNSKIGRGSYWSSQGTDDPDISETLVYNLTASFCVITEINLHPFKDLRDWNFPIYSSEFVRFRMGHPKSWKELNYDFIEAEECADNKFMWTYTSPMFPMAQENRLQRFKLPEPVVCIGGYLQIELSGRVQKAWDDKYYLCLSHVQAIGRKLSPAFSVDFTEPSNGISLMYDAEKFGICKTSPSV
ncbi:F-box protein At4g00755-like [Bidens hawaiensis]|uniref:F-box protein At4g00755-like n=1 Tax=Bidens hawaiensis TaxID=980011 RepID=UPI00404A63E2